MKLRLFALLLLGACTPRSYVPFTLGAPHKTVYYNCSNLIVSTPDSLSLAYRQALIGLVRAGYALKAHGKLDATSIMLTTKPKTVEQVAGLALQVTIQSIPTGSEVTFMSKYVPVDSLGVEEHDSRKWQWINYGVPRKNLPVQAFWADMHQAAVECFPGGKIGYY